MKVIKSKIARIKHKILLISECLALMLSVIILDKYLTLKTSIIPLDKSINTIFGADKNNCRNEDEELIQDGILNISFDKIPKIKEIKTNKKSYKVDDSNVNYLVSSSLGTLRSCNIDINSISDMFSMFYKDDNCNENINVKDVRENYDNIIKDTYLAPSEYYDVNVVKVYKGRIGFLLDDNAKLLNVEVYNTKEVFMIDQMDNFNMIREHLGVGYLALCSEEGYNYYKLMYRYKNLLISFISFYKDGRCNTCIISKA